jgi:hypothetical protein
MRNGKLLRSEEITERPVRATYGDGSHDHSVDGLGLPSHGERAGGLAGVGCRLMDLGPSLGTLEPLPLLCLLGRQLLR